MIIVKNMNTGFTHEVKPTMFPDGTSQVWKLPHEQLKGACLIVWHFENEAELIHLVQLIRVMNCAAALVGKRLLRVARLTASRLHECIWLGLE